MVRFYTMKGMKSMKILQTHLLFFYDERHKELKDFGKAFTPLLFPFMLFMSFMVKNQLHRSG